MHPNRTPDYSLGPANQPLSTQRGVAATAYLPRVEPMRVIGMLLRRSWIIALVAAVCLGGMWWYLKHARKVYQATGSVYVSARAPRVVETGAVAPEETRDLEQMRSVEQGLVASTLLMRVIDSGKLADQPDFTYGTTTRQELLAAFSKRVKVELRRGTRLIDIAVEDTDPERAQRLVGVLVSEYEKWNAERQGDLTRQVAGGISHEEEGLRERMVKSEKALQDFRDAHPIPGVGGRNGPNSDDLGRIESELTKVKAERLRLEAEADAFRKFDPDHPEAIAALPNSERSAGVLSLVRAVQDKQVEFAKVKERYLYKHPTYIEASNELKTLRGNLAEAARSAGEAVAKNYQIVSDNEAKLNREVATARSSTVAAEGLRAKFEALEREALADRTTHEAVASRLRETALAAAVPGPVLRWEDTPMVPEKPIKPRKTVMMALAGVGGMFFGLLLAVGLELTDGKVRDAAAAARVTGAPLLSKVAALREGGDADPVLISQPGSETSESFRRLRAALSPAPGHTGTTTVLFTSAKPGEGRSFCAMNYAASLAMQGLRTLLLDADMRRPGLSREHLRTSEGQVGLADYLAGAAEPAKACHPTTLPNLYLLSSGTMQANASELLSGTRFPALLEDAYRWFDCVVIDTPPVLGTSDALAISRYADRVCLVVREKASDRRDLRRAADLIRTSGGSLVGFVWNELSARAKIAGDVGPAVPVVRASLPAPQVAAVPPVAKTRRVDGGPESLFVPSPS
ncbi:polysaccharide biosynthesis tyrosine autokinase [Luteolibacter sp. LG18]|uniref:GumC family protein n=1 Tax=Luteolibacter sp. LG18 TaxID=2819286 RepID=UPI002B2F828B|nr:chain-length determining protein [Luteolibacter sp. LG18]